MSFINNQFKTPSYKPANLGFQPRMTGPKSKLGGIPTAFSPVKGTPSEAWRNLGKGKTVNDLMGRTVGPEKPPAQQTPAVTTQPTNQTGIVGSVPSGSAAFGTNPQMGTQTTTAPVMSTNTTGEKRMLKSDRDKQKKGLIEPTRFGDILGRLTGAASPTADQRRINQRLEQEASRNREIADQAKQYSEQFGNEIARVGQLGAGAVAGNMSTGSNVVGSGNAAIASNSASSRIAALSQAQQAALAGTGQQLTGQSQLQSALNQTAGNLNTQQAQQLSGLGTAGSLAAPNPAQYGQTVFDPATGQFTGGNLDPQTQAANLAQQVMSGAMTYDQAIASLGYAGSAGTNFLNNAITGAGGNPLQLQAQNAAQQANIATAGTAATDIARAGLGAVTPQYVQTEANVTAAKEQAGRALGILQQTGLNNVSSTDFNKAANELRSRMGDPNFAAFQTAINEAKNFYTSVLAGSGSTPSGNEEIAGNIAALNTNSPISAIVASLKELEFASATRLQSLASQQSQYNQNLGGGQSGGAGGFAEVW